MNNTYFSYKYYTYSRIMYILLNLKMIKPKYELNNRLMLFRSRFPLHPPRISAPPRGDTTITLTPTLIPIPSPLP